jgi:hypothetical protein
VTFHFIHRWSAWGLPEKTPWGWFVTRTCDRCPKSDTRRFW